MEINLTNFCDALRKSDRKSDVEDICETTGERYLIDNIISKFIFGTPVYMSDIDFSAFTEDDVVNLADNKTYEIFNCVQGPFEIAEKFMKSKPIAAVKRKFF